MYYVHSWRVKKAAEEVNMKAEIERLEAENEKLKVNVSLRLLSFMNCTLKCFIKSILAWYVRDGGLLLHFFIVLCYRNSSRGKMSSSELLWSTFLCKFYAVSILMHYFAFMFSHGLRGLTSTLSYVKKLVDRSGWCLELYRVLNFVSSAWYWHIAQWVNI